MIIQNALIGGFSFNRNALGGGSYQISPGFQEGTDGRTIISLWIARSVGKLPSTV